MLPLVDQLLLLCTDTLAFASELSLELLEATLFVLDLFVLILDLLLDLVDADDFLAQTSIFLDNVILEIG